MKPGLAILLLALLLAGCMPQPHPPLLRPWVYTDLRLLDETGIPETGPAPEQDLIAVYSRSLEDELQVRLDLLDVETRPAADIYLALDTINGGNSLILQDQPTGIDWDTLVIIPASGPIQVLNSEGIPRSGLSVRVLRDPLADTVSISLDPSSLPSASFDTGFQVFLTAPGGVGPVDSSLAIHSTLPTPRRAPALLAFWNTLPAYTPAQAMRRWDGAHSGPLGGRHGLRNLLRIARSHNAPLALLDLKIPSTLAALDYVEGVQMTRAMAAEGLLILPDAVPGDTPGLTQFVIDQALAESRGMSASARLPDSFFAYLPLSSISGYDLSNYEMIFSRALAPSAGPGNGITQILRSGTQQVLPIPDLAGENTGFTQVDPGGPPLEIRRALVEVARREMQDPGSSLLVLGGDLPNSPWGDPQFARLALDWIATHPWIKLLGPQDLVAWAPTGNYPGPKSEGQTANAGPAGGRFNTLAKQIHQAPPGPLSEAAWQAFFALFAQPSTGAGDLDRLRAHYAGQIGSLLAAARWSANPVPRQDCSQDLDQDGLPECVLASEDTFAIFEIASGSLSYLFACKSNQDSQSASDPPCSKDQLQNSVHQLVAPTSQFIIGQGDLRQVDFEAGLDADPEVIPGAFFDREASFSLSQSTGRLAFTSDNGYTKTYSLIPSGVQVEFQARSPLAVQIPLALDPWFRFHPDWGQSYSGEAPDNGWTWGLSNGSQVRVASDGQISATSFNDTRALMGSVEDPNTDFPPGHFLPFPISLLEVRGQGFFSVEIQLLDPD